MNATSLSVWLKGELFYELSVQTTLKNRVFLPYSMPPKPYHLTWSKALHTNLVFEDESLFDQKEVVVTLLTNRLPFTGYSDYWHGATFQTALPPAIKTVLADKLAVLDAEMRVCGNYLNDDLCLTAVWEQNVCCDWHQTIELACFFNLPLPRVLFEDVYHKKKIMDAFQNAPDPTKIGYEIRLKNEFKAFDCGKSVAFVQC